jgi:DNA-directed RNA polymerase, mitochondrial
MTQSIQTQQEQHDVDVQLSLHFEQLRLEEEARDTGIRKYREKLMNADVSEMDPGMQLMRSAILPTADAIQEFAEATNARRNGRLAKLLQGFSADYAVPAALVARACINACSKKSMALTSLAVIIARELETELNCIELESSAPGLARHIGKSLKKSTSGRHTGAVINHAAKKYGIAHEKWDSADRLQLGARMIHMFSEATGLIEVVRLNIGKHKSVNVVRGTTMALEWLEQAHARCELLTPSYFPMVVPPKPWTGVFGGGYLNAEQFGVRLIKTSSAAYLEEVDNAHMPMVYDAVNALQDTAWRINTDVLDVMREVWDGGGSLAKLPPREDMPLPTKPVDIDTNEEARNEWKRRATGTYEQNARLRSKRFAMSSKVWLAEKFASYPAIYFVWSLDWRGRAYPMTPHVHPQSDDSGKALLKFATKKPLGVSGLRWLRIHVANLFGIDKVSYAERISWFHDNLDAILDSGTRPLEGDRFWTTADKPWCALAACIEVARMRQVCGELGLTWTEYESDLPVSLDGSCNGLQNFSAMLRDERGGAAVNLLPSRQPQDVYNIVREAVERQVLADAEAGDEVAPLWQGRVTRKLVKRPVMTRPYGSGQYGMREQIEEEVKNSDDTNPSPMFPDVGVLFKATSYLAGVTFRAINETIVASKACMDWLQETARVAAKAGLPIHWHTPAGFPARQAYYEREERRVVTTLGTKRVRLTVFDSKPTLSRRLQAQGIAPNFVHSMDAAHMMRTITMCREQGVTAFSMVHDSYGTHAGDMETMNTLLRQSFIDQYNTDVLAEFREELAEQLPVELADQLPPVPAKGQLDLSQVAAADYFFS